jgi:hypothetical protein
MAIILATIASVFLFKFAPNWMFALGAGLVIAAIFLYSYSNRLMEALEETRVYHVVITRGGRKGRGGGRRSTEDEDDEDEESNGGNKKVGNLEKKLND